MARAASDPEGQEAVRSPRSIDRHRVGFSPLTGGVNLYRHGIDPGVAFDKRDALQEVMVAAGEHLLHGFPEGAKADLIIGDRKYVISIAPAVEEVPKVALCPICRQPMHPFDCR